MSASSAFLSRGIGVEQIGWANGRPIFITTAPLRYRSRRLGATVVVPKDFIFDGASVPRLPLTWWIAGGRALRSAALHDFCYQKGHLVAADDGRPIPVTRRLADAIFWESMAADPISGTNGFHRAVMWLAVRSPFGWWAWRQRERRAKALNPEWSATTWPTPEREPGLFGVQAG